MLEIFVKILKENPEIVDVWALADIPEIKALQLSVSQAYYYFMMAKLQIEKEAKNEP